MNKIALLLLVVLFAGCKKDGKDPEPSPVIKEIVGKWRLVATEYTRNGKWVRQEATSETYLVFRFDGLILGGDGLPTCCAPDSLVVNGKPFKIKPLAPVPYNELCTRVDCIMCDHLAVVQSGSELVTTLGCAGDFKSYYVRE